MEKRYQVFISSTYQDLREERHELIMALLELDAIPSGMELFPASDDDSWTLIRRVISECDYYVVVVGGRYGSIGPAGLSFTEMEYDYAVEVGKPVMGFLHENPGDLRQDKSELSDDGREKLNKFREKIKRRNCQMYNSAKDLGGKVSRSFIKLLKTHPATGWIRADHAASPELLAQVVRLREENDLLKAQLESLQNSAPAGAGHLAQGDDVFEFRISNQDDQSSTVRKTWNEIFSEIAPYLLNEANEVQIANALTKKMDDPQFNEYYSVDETDFQTIKLQLLALGLIRISEKRRSSRDSLTYWTLTPLGHTQMLRLRAIPRR